MLKTLRYAWIAAALTLAAAPSAHAGAPDMFYGVNAQNLFDNSSSNWGPQLAAMAAGGIQLARYDARWQNVEPNAPSNGHHTYNWGSYDSMVTAMAQHNIRWYPIIDYSTSWAGVSRDDANSEVAQGHVGDFATYANVFAQRYGRGGAFWRSHPSLPQLPVLQYEIWNEENAEARIAGFRATLDSLLGPQVPIEITEVGWASTSVSESDRAGYLAGLADQLPRSDCNITRLIPYSWTSAEQNRSRMDDWFGIFNHNATPKQSGT